MNRCACPHCRVVLTAPDAAGGKVVKCPSCGQCIRLPAPPDAPIAAAPTPAPETRKEAPARKPGETTRVPRRVSPWPFVAGCLLLVVIALAGVTGLLLWQMSNTSATVIPKSPTSGDAPMVPQRGATAVLSGTVKFVTPDAGSAIAAALGHSTPDHPVIGIAWKSGVEVDCCFDAEDERMNYLALHPGTPVTIKGTVQVISPRLLLMHDSVLLPEDGGIHIRPFDPIKAAADDAAFAQEQRRRNEEWKKRQEQDPTRAPGNGALHIPLIDQLSPKAGIAP